jgi:hypothetical protein
MARDAGGVLQMWEADKKVALIQSDDVAAQLEKVTEE